MNNNKDFFLDAGIPLTGTEFNEMLTDVHNMEDKSKLINFFPVKITSQLLPEKINSSPDSKQKGFRLYQITEMLLQCNAVAEMEAEENEGVISNSIAEELDKLEMLKSEKVLNIAKLILNLENQEEGFKNAIEKMTKRKKAITANKERLYNYLKMHLDQGEIFEDFEVKISWRKETGTDIYDELLLPPEYCSFTFNLEFRDDTKELINQCKQINPAFKKVPLIADKIKPDLKAKKEIPGAKLKDGMKLLIK